MDYEFVCEDDDGDWYYTASHEEYRRLKGCLSDPEMRGRAKGKYLPNPETLLAQRKKLYPHAQLKDISPTQATYKLWGDWNARQQIID